MSDAESMGDSPSDRIATVLRDVQAAYPQPVREVERHLESDGLVERITVRFDVDTKRGAE